MTDDEQALWVLDLAPGWVGEELDGLHSFHAEPEVGVLQVSVALSEGKITKREIREFTEDLVPEGTHLVGVVFGDFKGQSGEYVDGDVFCQAFGLAHQSLVLMVTYTCEVADRGQESQQVEAMLRSLRAEASAGAGS